MDHSFKISFAKTIRSLNKKGHSPATSTNYSFKSDTGECWVSKSGVDKQNFQGSDFIQIDENGVLCDQNSGVKASAETDIHCALYRLFPDARLILHSHSVDAVVLTASLSTVVFKDYEILKGFRNVETHAQSVSIPVVENSQNMQDIIKEIERRKEELVFGVFMIRKHGFYTWGTQLFEAKKYLETFTYLCECELKSN